VSLLKPAVKPALFPEDAHIGQYNLITALSQLQNQQYSDPRLSSLPPSRALSLQAPLLSAASEAASEAAAAEGSPGRRPGSRLAAQPSQKSTLGERVGAAWVVQGPRPKPLCA
jgi:hypothetical protein